ncbi:hypothetical protein [Butyrivibrio sp. AC2005]|uniref:hypothetical protein n=1 Tax=Butyrivibrio sp. AC2005 TaxID=1280672 RepID=UPI0003FBA9CA|nr:hypothetical protein [Butyrivibrio sp. AC2005]
MNNKPRYIEGSMRNKIVNLMHVSSVITPRSYKLLNEPQSSIANTMCKMKKEGVVEKTNNVEIFESLSLSNYKENLEEYFDGNIPEEHIAFFEEYGIREIKKAKYSKDQLQSRARRIIRCSETVILMYAAGIPTLPADKKYVVRNKMLTDNVYYQSKEIKKYSGYTDDVETIAGERTAIASRMNGTLLTAGGNYNIYHFGKDIQTWSTQGEYKIKHYIQNMLANYINQDSCLLNSAILFTYDLNIFGKMISPPRKYKDRYDGLCMTYDNLYVLPYDQNGRDMIKVMSESDWKARLYEYAMEEPYKDTSRLDYVCDYYDGDVYTFIFCVPDISRYIQFVRKVKFTQLPKEKFQVICFDYQKEFVISTIGKHANILSGGFKDFMDEWNQIRNRDQNVG